LNCIRTIHKLALSLQSYHKRLGQQTIAKYLPILLVMLLISGCSLMPATRSEQIASDEATPTPIPTAIVPTKPTYQVKKGEIVKELTFSARISPVVEEELFFRTNGRVESVFVKRNDFVEEGQVIAKFEITNLEREARQAELTLERAQVRLEAVERELEYDIQVTESNMIIAEARLEQLQAEDPIDTTEFVVQEQRLIQSQISYNRLLHGVDPLLQNDVDRAELLVQKLAAEMADAQIVAPFDGQILSISLTAGQAVEAYRPNVVVADVSELEVSGDLLSNQMEDLVEGMPVAVTLVSRPGEDLQGEIRRLPYPYGAGGRSSSGVDELDKSTRVELYDSAEDAGFELGDLVRVTVELERKSDILWLPPQALRVFDGRRFAVIQDGDAQRRVDVTTGIQTSDKIEIAEGLAEGQTVVGQ